MFCLNPEVSKNWGKNFLLTTFKLRAISINLPMIWSQKPVALTRMVVSLNMAWCPNFISVQLKLISPFFFLRTTLSPGKPFCWKTVFQCFSSFTIFWLSETILAVCTKVVKTLLLGLDGDDFPDLNMMIHRTSFSLAFSLTAPPLMSCCLSQSPVPGVTFGWCNSLFLISEAASQLGRWVVDCSIWQHYYLYRTSSVRHTDKTK